MMETVKLPKGVTVYTGGKRWSGSIPTSICPDKYLKKGKPAKGSSEEK